LAKERIRGGHAVGYDDKLKIKNPAGALLRKSPDVSPRLFSFQPDILKPEAALKPSIMRR